MAAALAKVYSLEVGETRAECTVTLSSELAEIEYDGRLPDGGWFRGRLEMDRPSFDRGVGLAQKHNITTASIGRLIQKVMGANSLVTIQDRPLLPR